MKKAIASVAVAISFLTSAPSEAAEYVFTFTGQSSISGSGTLVTSDTINGVGGYTITSISGIFNNTAISGLLNNPNQPNFSSNATFTWDNNLFPANPFKFNRYGLGFTAGSTQYNIYDAAADGASPPNGFPYGLLTNPSSGQSFGRFSITPVPEPATWAMMIVGFGIVGFAMRARRATSTTVYA